jgi:Tfp pilus assembly protein PilF
MPLEFVPEADRPSLKTATHELLESYFSRPDDAGANLHLGNYYLESRQLSKAIDAFKTAFKKDPTSIAPLVNLSLAYNIAGSNDLAEISLRQALKIAPGNAAVNLNLGMLLAEMNRLTEAEQAFRVSFQSDTNCAAAAYNLSILLSKTNPGEALAWSQKAVELRPLDPKYASTLAIFQREQGKTLDTPKTHEPPQEHKSP